MQRPPSQTRRVDRRGPRPAQHRRALAGALTAAILLGACGGGSNTGTTAESPGSGSDTSSTDTTDPAASISKSTVPYAAVDPAFYAASRFLEHATFGPIPADVESLRDGRFAAWIDAQLAMTPVPVDASGIRDSTFDNADQFDFMQRQLHVRALTAPDQLRLRMTWALSQLVVVSQSRVSGFAQSQYFKMRQDNVFGKYKDLLRKVSLHASGRPGRHRPRLGQSLVRLRRLSQGREDLWSLSVARARRRRRL